MTIQGAGILLLASGAEGSQSEGSIVGRQNYNKIPGGTIMPRTGENIYKRKDGRWEGRYIRERIDGKAKYGAVYAHSYRDVKRKLEEAKRKLAEAKIQENTGSGTADTKAGKVSDISGRWLAEAAVTLKKSSYIKYEDILRRYILPEFGETELSEITNRQVIDFANRLCVNGGAKEQGLAPSTAAGILSVMNRVRVYALRQDYTVMFSPECIGFRQKPKDIRVFSLEEEKLLLEYLQEHMDFTGLGVLLCLFTGIRLGELCAMRWDDIYLAEKQMHVRKTMQRLRVKDADNGKTAVMVLEPKSSSSVRIIPLPDVIMGLLKRFYAPGAYVLTGDSSRYMEPRTMQNHFKRILMSCGIRNANFHTTRHTFATRCIELGFDAKSLSEILGHASVSLTLNRYVHPTMALKAENMNRFSGLFAVK